MAEPIVKNGQQYLHVDLNGRDTWVNNCGDLENIIRICQDFKNTQGQLVTLITRKVREGACVTEQIVGSDLPEKTDWKMTPKQFEDFKKLVIKKIYNKYEL